MVFFVVEQVFLVFEHYPKCPGGMFACVVKISAVILGVSFLLT